MSQRVPGRGGRAGVVALALLAGRVGLMGLMGLVGLTGGWTAALAQGSGGAGGVECTLPIDTLKQIERLATPLADDEARWSARPALNRWLNPPSYSSPVRPDRYRLDARDIEAVGWLLRTEGQRQAGAGLLARALLLPQLETFASTAMQACGAALGDRALRAQLVELSRAWLGFVLAVYQRPGEAELVKRLQASRRKTFTLLRQAQDGDTAALVSVRGLVEQARGDAMIMKAAALYQEVARLREAALAARNAPAAAALSLAVHTAQQAEQAIGQAQAAANLQLLDAIAAAAPVVAALLEDSRRAAERESAMSDACGSESANQSMGERMSVYECRRRWEAAHPSER
jgi:hypothetical protein